jgi:hypothetical protein
MPLRGCLLLRDWSAVSPGSVGAKTAGLWGHIEEMIALGQVRAVDEVKREVTRHDDETAKWPKPREVSSYPFTRDVQEATSRVLERHPRLISLGSKQEQRADPFVVGLAMAHFGTVVTQETPSRKLHKPRIPDVCAAMGVPWMTLPQFVAEQRWIFLASENVETGPNYQRVTDGNRSLVRKWPLARVNGSGRYWI